jgi:hypothetical protein
MDFRVQTSVKAPAFPKVIGLMPGWIVALSSHEINNALGTSPAKWCLTPISGRKDFTAAAMRGDA